MIFFKRFHFSRSGLKVGSKIPLSIFQFLESERVQRSRRQGGNGALARHVRVLLDAVRRCAVRLPGSTRNFGIYNYNASVVVG
jgi:hypothetical protein